MFYLTQVDRFMYSNITTSIKTLSNDSPFIKLNTHCRYFPVSIRKD